MNNVHWLEIDGVPTRILTWGYDITNVEGNSDQHLIFLITGNPGIAEFYTEFLNKLYEKVELPILVASHAGHDLSESGLRTQHRNELYSLQQQVDHKANLLRKFAPKNAKIYIIGHSMGAKVALELLKIPEIEKRVEKCYMLFPTIEHIGDTPNAQFIKPFIKYCSSIVLFLSWIFTLFPLVVKHFLLNVTFSLTHGGSNECTVRGGMILIQPSVLKNVFYLTTDEMNKIKDLDVEVLKKLKNKLKFYYGTTDGWSPLKFYEHLVQEIPEIDAEVCSKGVRHAFTIKSATLMAEMISHWIKTSS